MIPEQRLSTIPVVGTPEIADKQPSRLISYEWGGVALNDPSMGLLYQVWTSEVVLGTEIIVYDGIFPPTTVVTGTNISEASLAFDQNMRPFLAFVENGQAKFYWYDSLIENFTTTSLPVGTLNPRATLDDHRQSQLGTSDIILTYLLNGNFYFRAQRDRYQIQYLLRADINLEIAAPENRWVCMTNVGRLQFRIDGVYGG